MQNEYKKCKSCKREYDVSSFTSTKRGNTVTCEICRKMAKSQKGNAKIIYMREKENFIRLHGGCKICQESDIEILDFDHLHDKDFMVSDWYSTHRNSGIEGLRNEMKKCQILCCFHHRLKTQEDIEKQMEERKDNLSTQKSAIYQRKRKSILKKLVTEEKLKIGGCFICFRKLEEENDSVAYDFDHLDPNTKREAVAELLHRKCSWLDVILPEIKKCRLLCVNCHRKESNKQIIDPNCYSKESRKRKYKSASIKYSEEDVQNVKLMYSEGTNVKELCDIFGISDRHTRNIIQGKRRKHSVT